MTESSETEHENNDILASSPTLASEPPSDREPEAISDANLPQSEPTVASGSPPPSGPVSAVAITRGPAQANQLPRVEDSQRSATIILPRRTVSLIYNE